MISHVGTDFLFFDGIHVHAIINIETRSCLSTQGPMIHMYTLLLHKNKMLTASSCGKTNGA